ncbi:MAG TPA: hypothetical protein VGM73_16500 [Candidatus Didemnitutus sp.]|jgi:hypothetical protein
MQARQIFLLPADIFAGKPVVAPHARVIESRDPPTNISRLGKTDIVFRIGIGSASRRLFESVNGLVGIQ